MSDRGIKKWNPYKSLPEQFESLEEEFVKIGKVDRPILSEDKEEEINEILTHYHGQTLQISYYKNGKIAKISDTIFKIDIERKKLVLSEGLDIKFLDILDIISID